PPPPRGRSSRGLASLTVRRRPWYSAPFIAAMASSAPLDISTNPNPRLRPVSRSEITCALVTVPYCPNSCSNSACVVVNGRFPTYRFFVDMSSLPGRASSPTLPGTSVDRPRRRDREDVYGQTTAAQCHLREVWLVGREGVKAGRTDVTG